MQGRSKSFLATCRSVAVVRRTRSSEADSFAFERSVWASAYGNPDLDPAVERR